MNITVCGAFRHFFLRMALLALLASGSLRAPAMSPSGRLPVFYVSTANGEEVTTRDNYIAATAYLDPCGTDGVEPLGSAEEPIAMSIKGRGNFTWEKFDKKPYKIKFDKKRSLLGMPSSKHFALMAHADDTLGYLRDAVGFELSRRIGMDWAPSEQPVELMMNGDYRGLYFLCETVRAEKSRVALIEQDDYEEDPEKITGGWLVEIDNYWQETGQLHYPVTPDGRGWMFTYHSPEELSEAQKDYLWQLIDSVKAAIETTDLQSQRWEEIIDIDEFVKFYIVNEIMHNVEAFHGSCYWHKERGADTKIRFGPVWDFGNGLKHGEDKWARTFLWQYYYYSKGWLEYIRRFPRFQDCVRKHWHEFTAGSGELPWLDAFIDERASRIEPATDADRQRWPEYGSSEYTARVAKTKRYLHDRLNFLESQWGGWSAIDDIKPNSTAQGTQQWFDITGRPVNNPQNGIYITRGKKIIIR